MADPTTIDGRKVDAGTATPVEVMNGASSPIPVSATFSLPAGAATEATLANIYALQQADASVTVAWDNVACTYDVNNNLTVAQYRVGLVVVATRTMTYDVNNNLLTMTKT